MLIGVQKSAAKLILRTQTVESPRTTLRLRPVNVQVEMSKQNVQATLFTYLPKMSKIAESKDDQSEDDSSSYSSESERHEDTTEDTEEVLASPHLPDTNVVQSRKLIRLTVLSFKRTM